MKRLLTLAAVALLCSATLHAQTNLVLSAPNSTTPGNYNVIINPLPGPSLTMTGSQNVLTGSQAGYSNQTGDWNTMSGYVSGYFNTTGGYNTFTGGASGYNNRTG
ncbi:MAG: hypothetical protein LH609_05675, partial [Rudanella sp.]|nr:hypothetical protein [Rudanella sp.]